MTDTAGTTPNFNAYGIYYNAFYRDKPYQAETDFVVGLIRKHNPQAQTLLDVGCGTGSYSHLFHAAGYTVQGIDISAKMIAIAREKGDGVNYQVGDARNYRATEPVDIVTFLFHVMSYQTTDADVIATLNSCAANVRSGGLLCFDVWHAPAVIAQQPERRECSCTMDDTTISRTASPDHDPHRRIVTVRYDIEVSGPGIREHFTEVHPMRYFDTSEIQTFLQEAGFDLLETTELISGRPPSPDTWGVLYLARKR